LLVATILTLVFLPTLYVAWFGWRESGSATRPPRMDCQPGGHPVREVA